MFKNQKGITLITLVITIVVLLILAGVGLNLVVGDGLLTRAQEAESDFTQSQSDEVDQMNALEAWMDQYID